MTAQKDCVEAFNLRTYQVLFNVNSLISRMGNHNKNVKPQLRNLPPKILISGEIDSPIGGGSVNGSSASDQTINIHLSQVDLGVAAQASINNTVRLHLRETKYDAYFDGQLLGHVPIRYNKTLLPGSVYKSQIIKLSLYGEPVVVVQVRLANI